MKKASCVLIIVLLLLLEISAKAEWVSIVELRQQVDEMGRWIQNYTDTYGRQIEVDVLPGTFLIIRRSQRHIRMNLIRHDIQRLYP